MSKSIISVVIILVLFVIHSFTIAFAGRDGSYEQLKQQDIERAIEYERLKNTKLPEPIRRSSLLDLPVDTDDDGMPDSYESANGLNPNDPDDAWLDPDSDDVVNLFEYQLGSDLNSSATPPTATVASLGADHTDVATAIDAVAPGTCIRVAEGTYLVNYLTFSTKVVMIQGGWKSDFSKRDLKLHSTTFDGGMSDEILYFSNDSGEAVIILDGLHFVRGNGFFGAVNLLADGNVIMKTSIFNCSITESISDSSSGGVLNITNRDTSESDRTIANTMIVGNESSGIKSSITDEATARWRIINTTISNNLNGSGSSGHGVDVFTLDTGELTAHIYNSIIRGNETEDIDISRSINFRANHSDIGNVSATSGAVYQPGTGVVNVDPLFVDPTNSDFHLQSTSPLINQGTNQGIPLIDFEGEPRVSGTAADMGADEFVGSEDPIANIKANGSDGPVTPTGNLSVTVALDPGNRSGDPADWWVAANVSGTSIIDGWYYFDLSTLRFVLVGDSPFNLIVTHQGPLFNLATFQILNISVSGLPSGTYKFYLAVDMNMNVLLDLDELFFDFIVVNINP